MKSKYLILVFSVLAVFSCMIDEDHLGILSETDLVALEGMSENYEWALQYNDSLMMCTNEVFNCDSITMFHYDDMFHQFDDMFSIHHDQFSHDNVDDDHHHSNGQTVWHGNMMGHDDNHAVDDDHGEYAHNNESLEEMMHLRELHEDIHPE